MNILVTGGGGFIGSSLVKALIKRNYRVSSLSRNTYSSLEKLGVDQFQGAIHDREVLLRACEGKDAVFHIAAKVGLWGSYEEFYSANVQGTKQLVDASLSCGLRYLVFTSSASVVFDGKHIVNGDESLPYPCKKVSNYTDTKRLAEEIILSANGADLKTISLRPHLVWGPGDRHLIPGILEKARTGRLRQIGDNSNYVDTTYIDNYTDAQLCALDALTGRKNVDGRAYFITNGEAVKVWDFVNAICKVYGLPPIHKKMNREIAYALAWALESVNKVFLPGKEPLLTRFIIDELCNSHWFDISRAKEQLGYAPAVSMQAGMALLARASEKSS